MRIKISKEQADEIGTGWSKWISEPGIYKLRIINCEDGISSKGNDMVTVSMQCVESDAMVEDRLVYVPPSETSKGTFWKIATFSKSAGKRWHDGEEVVINNQHFKGRELVATVIMDRRESRDFAKIDRYECDSNESLFIESESKPEQAKQKQAEANDGFADEDDFAF